MTHPDLNHGGEFVWDNAVVGMAFVGYDGRFLKVNPAFCRTVGYTEAELLSRTWMDVTVEEDIEADRIAVAGVIDGSVKEHRMLKTYRYKGDLDRIPADLTVYHVDIEGVKYACLFSQILPRKQAVQRVQIVHEDPETGEPVVMDSLWGMFKKHPVVFALCITAIIAGPEAIIAIGRALHG